MESKINEILTRKAVKEIKEVIESDRIHRNGLRQLIKTYGSHKFIAYSLGLIKCQ
jgi:Fe-S cluster assembly iron-binding protein IscA